MEPPKDDLELILAEMTPEMQRSARRALHEWGIAPTGSDSFPVRLTLLTRVQLHALTKSAKVLIKTSGEIDDTSLRTRALIHQDAEARKAILAKIRQEVDQMKLLLSQEVASRRSYLESLQAAEWGEAHKIQSAARQLGFTQTRYLEKAEEILRKCPTPEKVLEVLRETQRQSLETKHAVAELSRATDQMLRAATRMDTTARELQREQVQQRLPPPPPPPPPPPSAPSTPSATASKVYFPISLLIMFILAFGAIGLGQLSPSSPWLHLLSIATSAFCLVFFLIVGMCIFPDLADYLRSSSTKTGAKV